MITTIDRKLLDAEQLRVGTIAPPSIQVITIIGTGRNHSSADLIPRLIQFYLLKMDG
jgi:hypothetical protein